MTNFQHDLDDLDRRLEAGETPVPEGATEETKVLAFAVEAIRFDALNRRVRRVLEATRTAAPAPIVRRIPSLSLRIAASVILLLCLAGIGKFLLTTPTTLYDKMYAPYDMGTTRGGEDLDPLEHAYQSKAWSAVDDIFRVKAYPSPEDRFLAGMAYMEQGQYAPAINQFRTVERQGTDFRDESEYYLALAYLATHQTDSALLLLRKIRTDPEHLFHRKAMELNGLDLLILGAK